MRRRVRTPTVIQMEAVECGAASLAIVLGYFGCFVPLEELRVTCGVTRDGSNALNLVKAARTYGLHAIGFKAEIEDIKAATLPLIVFWEFNHFIVVEGFSDKKVFINDPAAGPRAISYEEFDEKYTGVALRFEKTEDFKTTKGPRKLWSLLKSRLTDVKAPLAFLTICGFGLLFPGLFMPATSQVFFDNVLSQGIYSWIFGLFIVIVGLAAVSFLFVWLQNTYLNRLSIRLSSVFSLEFLWHILHLPVQFYAQRFSGEIAYRMRLNDMVAKSLTGSLVPTIVNVILLIFYAVVMFSYDVSVAMIGVVAAIINLIVLLLINRSRVDAYARMQQESGKSVGFSIGALQNIETIKAAGNELDFFARWAGYTTKKLNAQAEINAKDVLLTSIPPFLQGAAITALLGIGAWRIIHGDLTIGMLMALQALMNSFLLPVNQLVNLGSTMQTIKIDVDRIDDCLKNPIDVVYASAEKKKTSEGKLEGYLELRNVTFGYSPADPPLIENFSFILKPGQRVAFVGPSGSGKTTIAKLISTLYQPWSGEILYDGVPVNQIPRSVFTNSVGYVDQRIVMFAGTIRENLTLWDTTIPEEAIISAAKDACIHDEVVLRADGYDGIVSENGTNFSGGQRQRLEIAKSLISNPRVLIMDEATSTLDSLTELEISQNIRRRGCTCAMIAHRLSTIRDCDEIIVLERGKIVERGTHEELKALKGVYQELVGKEQVYE
jgi:ATP-binding cassette subfamily C protein